MPLHRLVCFAVLLAGLATASPALAQNAGPAIAPRPAAAAVRTATPPDVDGDLGDAAWAAASPASGFVQREPRPGTPASERTEVRLLYDESAIYVGARLYDAAPDSVVSRLLRRDDGGFSDWFYVAFDSYGDDRTGFAFGVNPRGVQHDFLLFDDTSEDGGWDAVWDAGARVDSLGWTVEMRVPLSQLRYRRGPGELAWGVQFQRVLARRNEASFRSPAPPTEVGLVSLFGSLGGVRDLPPSRRVELRLYVSTRLARGPGDAADPFYETNALAPGAGFDAKVGLTSGLTLSATVNPDFGQVEADPAEVNLSVFETFFPERRPFFLEGAEQFQFASARSTIRIVPRSCSTRGGSGSRRSASSGDLRGTCSMSRWRVRPEEGRWEPASNGLCTPSGLAHSPPRKVNLRQLGSRSGLAVQLGRFCLPTTTFCTHPDAVGELPSGQKRVRLGRLAPSWTTYGGPDS